MIWSVLIICCRICRLVLQLRFEASLIVGFAGLCVVADAPIDPPENESA
jgi:hypothetical protein